jgi:Flp pilus assembly protein TadB
MTDLMKLVSSICVCCSLALFIQWLLERMALSYALGLKSLERLEYSQGASANMPGLEWLNRVAIVFLPMAERLKAQNRFGAEAFLAEWDKNLTRAGIRQGVSPEQFLAVSLSCGCIAGLAVVISLMIYSGRIGWVLAFPPAAALGFMLPAFTVRNMMTDRISLIEKRLPFAVEFMVLAMEARASFPAAIEVYCSQAKNDPLADELRQVLRDLELRIAPEEALLAMAERLQSNDITAFVVAVNSGVSTGQPLQEVLQIQSDVARNRRFENAEQVAKSASARATVPMFIVALAVLLLLVGPLLILVSRQSLF